MHHCFSHCCSGYAVAVERCCALLPDSWETMLEAVGYTFTAIFLIECILKIIGLGGMKSYLSERVNVFDFTLVCLSLAASAVTLSGEACACTSNALVAL